MSNSFFPFLGVILTLEWKRKESFPLLSTSYFVLGLDSFPVARNEFGPKRELNKIKHLIRFFSNLGLRGRNGKEPQKPLQTLGLFFSRTRFFSALWKRIFRPLGTKEQ